MPTLALRARESIEFDSPEKRKFKILTLRLPEFWEIRALFDEKEHPISTQKNNIVSEKPFKPYHIERFTPSYYLKLSVQENRIFGEVRSNIKSQAEVEKIVKKLLEENIN